MGRGYRAVLFDFFGTLVHYSSSWTEQGYEQSHAVLRSFGVDLSYDGFLNVWWAVTQEHEDRAEAAGGEFTMDEVTAVVLERVIGTSSPEQVDLLRDAYVAEWSTAVHPIPGVAELVEKLSQERTVAVVSNTHDMHLVPRLLDVHGMAEHVTATVLSVELGVRKPWPGIYRETVDRLAVDPSDCLFVGDSFVPDYIGPTRFGMDAVLIDPERMADVPAEDRIEAVTDLAGRFSLSM
jgi:putative hydrolase of the HAD superfamily